jgi:hypothetical protein
MSKASVVNLSSSSSSLLQFVSRSECTSGDMKNKSAKGCRRMLISGATATQQMHMQKQNLCGESNICTLTTCVKRVQLLFILIEI